MAMPPSASPSRTRCCAPLHCRRRPIRRSSNAISTSISVRQTELFNVKSASVKSESIVLSWIRSVALAASAACIAWPAHAQLQVDVTQGVTDPIPIAVVPFTKAAPADGGLDEAEVVAHDLASSGRFRVTPRSQIRTTPNRIQDAVIADWKADGNDYLVVGRVTALQDGNIAVDYEVANTLSGQTLGT